MMQRIDFNMILDDEMVGKATEAVTFYNTDVKNWPMLRELKAITPEEEAVLEASLAASRKEDTDPLVY
ncbi:MAG: hypothetical protein PHD91_04155 [bacterium]|jgi:hypothetical protein|nr:hypothetical protein [bacterium]MDD3806055.1 hypothetical protein [bacterium]MDD4152891.1 hypothetical protein [bacterium]MDD4558693.1 hypothetical protein [bacterium]